jgi:thioredoxin reductase (NADPH)
MADYDLIVIGAGPAGLSAGIYGARRNLKTLVLEGSVPGGQMGGAPLIENYPGFESVSGMELAQKMEAQAKKFGCEIKYKTVMGMEDAGAEKKVLTQDNKTITAKALIIATGAAHRKLGIAGEDKFLGKGISYCATCDAPLFKNKKVAVIGGSDAALMTALYLLEYTKEVWLIHRRDALRAEEAQQKKLLASPVKMLWNSVVTEVKGDRMLSSVVVQDVNTKEKKEMPMDGLFIYVGTVPTTELAQKAGIKLDERGFVITDQFQQTNVPGIFAAGDICGRAFQVADAVGQGCVASISAYFFIKGMPMKGH